MMSIQTTQSDLEAAQHGNAIVPGTVPILPVQAWVDAQSVFDTNAATINASGWVLANKGITHFDPLLIYNDGTVTGFIDNGLVYFALTYVTYFTLDLSGNALSSSEVNAILAACADGVNNFGNPTGPGFSQHNPILLVNGGTNGAPTGQGITDAATLISDSNWTVTTN